MKKLIIAEKPSVASVIAKTVKANEKKNGWYEGENYLVSWCKGHLVSLSDASKYDENFKFWRLEDLPIVPKNWKYESIKGNEDRLKILKRLSEREDVSSLIEATDAGREGELIFRLVYDYIGCTKPFERLWISSLESSAIKKGMDDLKPSKNYDNLFKAAAARQKADWLYGINGSRFYSIVSGNGNIISVGRVQTPTLNMIVQRQTEIENFKKEIRFKIVQDFNGWKLESEKFTDKEKVDDALFKMKNNQTFIIRISKEKKKASPPLLYSLTSLQQDANRKLGITAQQTLDTIQELYERKILSYPRTDSNFITSDMKETMEQIILSLKNHMAPNLVTTGVERLIDDNKVTDHYAIIITGLYARNLESTIDLNKTESDILALIKARILESVSTDYEWEETKIEAECGGFKLTGTGKKIIMKGWKETEDKYDIIIKKKATENMFPFDITEGKNYSALKTFLENCDTKPPRSYTEDTLLGAMEKAGSKDMDDEVERKGIGTSSTRAGIIETLLKRGFIMRDKKALIPTELGRNVIKMADDGFKQIETTVTWENRLLDIEKGRNGDTEQKFCDDIEDDLDRLIKTSRLLKKEPFGNCPICGGTIQQSLGILQCDKCGRKIYKSGKMLKGHTFTDEELRLLFTGQNIIVKAISGKSGKPYNAKVSLDYEESRNNEKYFNLKFVDFDAKDLGTCPMCEGRILKTEIGTVYCSSCKRHLTVNPEFLKRTLYEEEIRQILNGKKINISFHSKKTGKTIKDVKLSIDKEKTGEKFFSYSIDFPSFEKK